MAEQSLQKILRILSVIPLSASVIVGLIITAAFHYQPDDIPGLAYVVSFTLAEAMMLVAAIGILATIKLRLQTPLFISLRYLNIAILAGAGVLGFVTFMQMAP